MSQVRFATIGTSMITGMFIEACESVDEAVYVGSFSRDAAKADAFTSEHGGQRSFTSLEEIASAHDIDAVYVGSPNVAHYEQSLMLARAGKHLLVEKSMCPNHDLAAEVIDCAHLSNVIVMEAMRSLHDPALAAIKAAMPKLGPVRAVNLRYGKYSSRYDEVLAGRQTNIFDSRMATGSLMDLGVYTVEPMVELFGIPNDTRCFCHKVNDDIDVCGAILADYDGLVVELAYSKCSNDLLPSQIMGELGTMVIDHISGPTSATITYRDGSTEQIELGTTGIVHPDYRNNMAFEIRDFCHAVAGEYDVTHCQRVTLASLAIMDDARLQTGISFPTDKVE